MIAINRYFKIPYQLMAAPGKLSLDCCKFDCKVFFLPSMQHSFQMLGAFEGKEILSIPAWNGEKVIPKSPADCVGILQGMLLSNVAKTLFRVFWSSMKYYGTRLGNLWRCGCFKKNMRCRPWYRFETNLAVDETGPYKLYKWPLHKKCTMRATKIRCL